MISSLLDKAIDLLDAISKHLTPEQLEYFQQIKNGRRESYLQDFDNYNFD